MIFDKALEIKDYMVKARRYLHENPEIGLEEHITTKFIKNELKDMGVEIQDIGMDTGAIGIIKGEKQGANICTAIRGDIDALPLEEKTGAEYCSKIQGMMHACGHDGHTAVLLGVAKLLNGTRKDFTGTVKLLFQPAEEGRGGAKKMVEMGALDNPRPERVLGLHCAPKVEVGKITINRGRSNASADSFKVKVIGRGGHGARPSESINPIICAVQIIQALQAIVSNEIPSLNATVITVTTFHGGTASNIIPDDVEFTGTVRCLEEENRMIVKEKIERIVKGICIAQNCQYEYKYNLGVAAVINDNEVMEEIVSAAKKAMGEDNVKITENPSMGSEDFSELALDIGKGGYFSLGVKEKDKEKIDIHNDRFDFNDNALPYGVAVFVQYVLDKHK